MIIKFPTGLYKSVLPINGKSGNITYTISSMSPPRPFINAVKLPTIEELKVTPDKVFTDEERREQLGELVFTVVNSNRSLPGSNTKTFEIGEILAFENLVPVEEINTSFFCLVQCPKMLGTLEPNGKHATRLGHHRIDGSPDCGGHAEPPENKGRTSHHQIDGSPDSTERAQAVHAKLHITHSSTRNPKGITMQPVLREPSAPQADRLRSPERRTQNTTGRVAARTHPNHPTSNAETCKHAGAPSN